MRFYRRSVMNVRDEDKLPPEPPAPLRPSAVIGGRPRRRFRAGSGPIFLASGPSGDRLLLFLRGDVNPEPIRSDLRNPIIRDNHVTNRSSRLFIEKRLA